MISLSALNSYSNNTITFTDNRPSNVIFDYPTARDINRTLTGTTFTLETLINIVDIIKASEANVTFAVDLSSVPGSAINWGTLPNGVSQQVINNVYTLLGISSAQDWQDIKEPTLTAPIDFQGNFIYNCTISYTQAGKGKTQTWQVGNFIPIVLFEAEFTSTIQSTLFKGTSASFSNNITLEAKVDQRIILEPLTINATTSAITNGERIRAGLSALITEVDLTGSLSGNFTTTSNLQVTSNIDVDAISYNFITPSFGLNYYTNEPSELFISISMNPNISSIKITLDVRDDNAYIQNVNSNQYGYRYYEFTTTPDTINSDFNNLRILPNYNETAPIVIDIEYYLNDILIKTGVLLKINQGAPLLGMPDRYIDVLSSTSLQIPFDEYLYCQADTWIIGGGGGGGASIGGGGGAAGVVRTSSNFNFLTNVKVNAINISNMERYNMENLSATIGSGGFSGSDGTSGGSTLWKYTNTAGSLVTALTAPGGGGGFSGTAGDNPPNFGDPNIPDADGGDNNDFNGGVGFDGPNASGGGGAGAAGNGANATVSGQFVGGLGGLDYTLPSGFNTSKIGRGGKGSSKDNINSLNNTNPGDGGVGFIGNGVNGGLFVKIYAK